MKILAEPNFNDFELFKVALQMYVQMCQHLQTLDAVPTMVLIHVARNRILATKEKETAMMTMIARGI